MEKDTTSLNSPVTAISISGDCGDQELKTDNHVLSTFRFSVLAAWTTFSLSCGAIVLGHNIRASDVAIAAISIFASLRCCAAGRLAPLINVILIMALCASWALLVGGTNNHRLVPELAKMVLLLTSALLIASIITWKALLTISRTFPTVLLILMAFVALSGQGDYYGNEGRFGVVWWGSPNVTAFVAAIAMAMVLFDLQERRESTSKSYYEVVARSLKWVELLMLGLSILATQSSGGLVTAAVIVLRYLGVSLKILLTSFLLIVVTFIGAVALSPIQFPELLGAGRLFIWKALIAQLFDSNVITWLVGFGPGAIDLHPWFTAHVVSAHSMYVEILYGFGLLGFCVFLAAIVLSAKALSRARLSPPQRTVLEAIFIALIISFSVDTYLMTAQIIWLGALLLGTGGLISRSRAERWLQ